MSAFLIVAIVVIIILMLMPEIEPYLDDQPQHPQHPQHPQQPVNPDPLNNYIIIPDRPYYPMLAKNACLPSYQNISLPIDNRSHQEASKCDPSLPHTCRSDGVAVGVQGRIF